jgi:glycosyltransferase involved in cell wall biosynthesis
VIDVSAVVPSHNNERTIQKCLGCLKSNKVREVIVVDGGSKDRTLDVVSRFSGVRTILQTRPLGKAREVGWREADSEFVLFIDADAYLRRVDALGLLLEHFSRPEIAGVSCRVACANPERLLPRLRHIDFQLEYPVGFERKEVTECVADPFLCGLFRREALRAIHGFGSTFEYAEDLYFLHKLRAKGYRILTTYNPPVFHYHRENLRDLYAQFYHHGFGRRMLMEEMDASFYRNKNTIEFVKRITAVHPMWRDRLAYPFYRVTTEVAFLMGYVLEVNRRLSRTSM